MVSRRNFIASIRERIASGEWPPGAVLPSSSMLQEEYGVGLTMVNAVMQTLIETGEVTSRAGGERRVGSGVPPSEKSGEINDPD